MTNKYLEFKWTVSRGRDTYGYNICSLYVDGKKMASCNGGGYDMQGTCLGNWIARAYPERLLEVKEEFYGLRFYDPNFDPGKVVLEHAPVFGKDEDKGKTVEQLEKEGKSLGLERYQQFHGNAAKVPTERHVIPRIDGACGMSSVQRIGEAIGMKFEYVPVRSKNITIYKVTVKENADGK